MGWQRIGADILAILGLTVYVGGCAAQTGSQVATRTPDLAARVAAAGTNPSSANEARAQMPENPNNGVPKKESADQPDAAPAEAAAGQLTGRIEATVNGEVILTEELEFACNMQMSSLRNMPEPLRSQEIPKLRKTTLEDLIDREVILQEVFSRLSGPGKEGVLAKLKKSAHEDYEKNWLRKTRALHPEAKTEEEFRDMLRSQGFPIELFRRQYERNFIKIEYLRSRVQPLFEKIGHPQILEYYEQHPEDFKIDDGVAWQDLFIDASRHPNREAARSYAEALAQRARGGEDFVKLVDQYDNGDSKARQGAGEGRRPGEISPHEADAVLFSLNDGEVRVVEMITGFHVVRLVKRDREGVRPFDDKVQKAIGDRLKGETFQREVKRIIADLRRQAIVEYYSK